MVNEKVLAAIKAAREGSAKRNFRQSFDMAVNFKNIDPKKPEGKIKAEIRLPNPPAGVRIGIFADTAIPQVKKLGDRVILISKDQLEGLAKNKKAAKALAKQAGAFLAEAPLMPQVAKALGPVLAVRGKMPRPIPPTLPDFGPVVDITAATVKIAVKDSPVVHLKVGTEDMKDEQVAANVEVVFKAILSALPKGKEQIKDAVIKLTMGKPVKMDAMSWA